MSEDTKTEDKKEAEAREAAALAASTRPPSAEDGRAHVFKQPTAGMVGRFEVPQEMAPGIYRDGVGFFRPGDVLSLPDAASAKGDFLSLKLIPLDENAAHMLQETISRRGHEAVKLAMRPKDAPEAKVPQLKAKPIKKADEDETKKVAPEKGLTMRQLAARGGNPNMRGGRAADR